MKHGFNSEDVWRHYNGPSRPPLRTATEMAQEFGLSLAQLSRRMTLSGDAPMPVMKHTGSPKARNTWYNPAEMREWWKRHNAK